MSFFEATSEVFDNLGEYFKVFIAQIIVSISAGFLSIIPFVGWILTLLVGYYAMFIVPVGIYKIKCDGKVNIVDLLDETYNIATHPGKASRQVLKLIVVLIGLTVCLLCFITAMALGLVAFALTESGILVVFGSLLCMGMICIAFSFVYAKLAVNLMYDILSLLLGDDELSFREQNKETFRYDFLWLFVPVINIWAEYALMYRYLKYYEKNKSEAIIE